MLRCTLVERPINWVEELPTIELALNSRTDSTTNMRPFEVIYGYPPRLINVTNTTKITDKVPAVKDIMEQHKKR